MKPLYNTILSYGAGIGSTALLVAICNGNYARADPKSTLVVFADTGVERPWTYHYLPVAKKYCKVNGIRFDIVRARYNLENYVYYYGILPSRRMRWCTQKLKIQPIRYRALREDVSIRYLQLIGFDATEENRTRKKPLFANCTELYPLIELGWDRRDCAHAILRAGLPLPKKSACFCCPFQRLSTFASVMRIFPDLAIRTKKMEEFANRNRNGKPPFYLFREPVEQLLERTPEILYRASRRGTLLDDFGMLNSL